MIVLGIFCILISLPLMVIPFIGIPLFIVGIVLIFSSIGKKNSQRTADAVAKALNEQKEKS